MWFGVGPKLGRPQGHNINTIVIDDGEFIDPLKDLYMKSSLCYILNSQVTISQKEASGKSDFISKAKSLRKV